MKPATPVRRMIKRGLRQGASGNPASLSCLHSGGQHRRSDVGSYGLAGRPLPLSQVEVVLPSGAAARTLDAAPLAEKASLACHLLPWLTGALRLSKRASIYRSCRNVRSIFRAGFLALTSVAMAQPALAQALDPRVLESLQSQLGAGQRESGLPATPSTSSRTVTPSPSVGRIDTPEEQEVRREEARRQL